MSISRFFDAWMADNGIQPEAEVVPDHACQVFLPGVGSDHVRIIPVRDDGEQHHINNPDLDAARRLVEEHLR